MIFQVNGVEYDINSLSGGTTEIRVKMGHKLGFYSTCSILFS